MRAEKQLVIVCWILAMLFVRLPAEAEALPDDSLPLALRLNLGPVIELPAPGCSQFLLLLADLPDGRTLDATQEASYYEDDRSVCLANGGRLLAIGAGETVIHVAYGGFQLRLLVRVLSADSLWEPALRALRDQQKGRPLSASQKDILGAAFPMLSLRWTPQEDLDGWDMEHQYKAGGTYTGLPYSQCARQNDAVTYLADLGGGTAYSFSRSPGGVIQSAAGNDCSGFVSHAWSIDRLTTWGFDHAVDIGRFSKLGDWVNFPYPNPSALLRSYPRTETGDALISTANGHIVLVFANDPKAKLVYCFEQTPPSARLTVWSYRQLAQAFYKPIRR